MTYFSIKPAKSKKRKPTARERELAKAWEKIKASHTKLLEKGAKANGLKQKPKVVEKVLINTKPEIPPLSLKSFGTATKPVIDPLAGAKRELAPRVGPLYNKSGLHYLSDVELADQKKGTHRRRS